MAHFQSRVIEASLRDSSRDRALALVERIYPRSGIGRRSSVVEDYAHDDPSRFRFYPSNWALDPVPTTADRMKFYEEASVTLAEEAARAALANAGIKAQSVTHLVLSTCTGFFAPGPDVLLVHRLGLGLHVRRTVIGFMGCYAGFNGIRCAQQIVRAEPEAVVLQVCVELCSLHFQRDSDPESLVSNCLFGDGSAAAVFAGPQHADRKQASLVATHTALDNSLDHMTWRIGDHGFRMRLSTEVPRTLKKNAVPFVDALLDFARTGRKEGGLGWAIHPGGRQIVDALGEVLDLEDRDLESSRRVLLDHGNMSSATILFVLNRALTSNADSSHVVALGFGPGLTMEGAVFRRDG